MSANWDKLLPAFLGKRHRYRGPLGGRGVLCMRCGGMYALTSQFLARNPDLFADHEPIDERWYR